MSENGETENLMAAIEERIRKLLDQPRLSEARRERLRRILAEVEASRRDA